MASLTWLGHGSWKLDTNDGKRLYVHFGHQGTACLDLTGKVVWRVPTDLPVWGSPAYGNDAVLFGLGNGRLLDPPALPEKPAGALMEVLTRMDPEAAPLDKDKFKFS